jgi:tetratricopeptide (TPR) repeat protein
MTARARCLTLIAFAALSVLGTPIARAEDKAAAREHYDKGTTYYDLGKYPDAAREFEAAYEAKKDPAFLYNLAQSYRLAGDSERALHFYRTYLRYVPKAPNRTDIEQQIKALELKVATQAPPTSPPPAGTEPTKPGATAPLPPPQTATPTAPLPPEIPSPGGTAATTLSPVATPPLTGDTGAVPPPAPRAGRAYRIAGLATGGAGVVMILIGLAEGGIAKTAGNDVEDAAKHNQPFDPDTESRGKSAEKAQWWLLGLGAVAGAAGVGLWYYGHHLGEQASATGTVSFAPVVGPGHGGALVRVTF